MQTYAYIRPSCYAKDWCTFCVEVIPHLKRGKEKREKNEVKHLIQTAGDRGVK